MVDNGAQFGVLGPLQICVDGAPVALGTPKQRAVLAMLLINRNRPVATEALIEAAWEAVPAAGSAREPALVYIQPPQAAGQHRRRLPHGIW